MNRENRLITTEDGKIAAIGRRLFSYLDLKRDNPFAYPDGALEKGDFMVYIDLDCQGLGEDGFKAISRFGIDAGQLRKAMICIGIYGDKDAQPLFKDMELGEGQAAQGIDTYFEGNEISVLFQPKTSEASIKLNGQRITAAMGGSTNALFCFNGDGVKFFSYSRSKRIENLAALLDGGFYHGYSKTENYFEWNLNARDAFGEPFFEILERAVKLEDHGWMGWHKGESFFVFAHSFQTAEGGYRLYDIQRKQELMGDMSRAGLCYRRLALEEHKWSNNTLACGFRLWGRDPALLKIKALLQKAAGTGVTILLTGESGTGKTFIAKEIHKNSKRSSAPFVHVNCAAIPYQLIESELFGYEEGSFTGARKGGKKGYFEMARGGIIFLDEITEMPLALQGKLLEVIQDKTFFRVGGGKKIHTDVRLIGATNRNLKELVLTKQFREDLYYRINVFPIELPPLRSRKDVLMQIVGDVLPEICRGIEVEPLVVSGLAMEKMKKYHWPGNIRELENVLAKAAVMCDGKVILSEDIEFQEDKEDWREEDWEDGREEGDRGGKKAGSIICENAVEQGREEKEGFAGGSFKEQKELYERRIILDALRRFRGARAKTAEYLGIGRTSLFEKIKKYGLENQVEEERDTR